ncbi:hypothetical protein HDU97_003523 [Phlyctochytrium planicorne]|nr:hypothetical protein HDU97_003523 [Phlyctochytrium planicorne]
MTMSKNHGAGVMVPDFFKLQLYAMGNAIFVFLASGSLMLLARFLIDEVRDKTFGSGSFHPAAVACVVTIFLYEMFQMAAFSFVVKGFRGIWLHLQIFSFSFGLVVSAFFLSTAFMSAGSRITVMILYFFDMLICHLGYNVIICERKDPIKVFFLKESDWGPRLPMSRILNHFNANLIMNTLTSILAYLVQILLFLSLGDGKKEGRARGFKLDIQHLGNMVARDGKVSDVHFWVVASIQICFGRLIPRVSKLFFWFRKRLQKKVLPRDRWSKDQDLQDIPEVPETSMPPKGSETRDIDCFRPVDVGEKASHRPRNSPKRKSTVSKALAVAVDMTIEAFEDGYVIDRNDFIFTCYKATMVAASTILILKCRDEDFIRRLGKK